MNYFSIFILLLVLNINLQGQTILAKDTIPNNGQIDHSYTQPINIELSNSIQIINTLNQEK